MNPIVSAIPGSIVRAESPCGGVTVPQVSDQSVGGNLTGRATSREGTLVVPELPYNDE